MMYVPGLMLGRTDKSTPWSSSVVQMFTQPESAVGTSAYIVGEAGAGKLLQHDKNAGGYTESIPTLMAKLFPNSRYAAYPMVFHRASKVGSLVNPQLDDFRRVMFSRNIYQTWERLMVTTGWGNEKVLPVVLVTLTSSILGAIGLGLQSRFEEIPPIFAQVSGALAVLPVVILSTGFFLFASGRGYAEGQKEMESARNAAARFDDGM